jgi:hypothetical protein
LEEEPLNLLRIDRYNEEQLLNTLVDQDYWDTLLPPTENER